MATGPDYNTNWLDYQMSPVSNLTNWRPTTWNSSLTNRPTFSSLGNKPVYTPSPQQLAAAGSGGTSVVKGLPNWALAAVALFVIMG